MAKKQKPKKQLSLEQRYAHIPENKPLTTKELAFAYEFAKTKDRTQSALKVGYAKGNARQIANTLINHKPNTRKFIADLLKNYFDRLEFDAHKALQHLGYIAFGDRTELVRIVKGRVKVTDTDQLSAKGKAIFAGAKERINESGHVAVEVKMIDPSAALKTVSEYLGIIDKSRRQKQVTYADQKEALKAVRDGEKTVIEACIDLELAGIPIPETLRILLSKHTEDENDPNDGDMIIPSAEEMEAKREKRLAEIKAQKKDFVPKRQEEVREMKKELGAKNQEWNTTEKGADANKTDNK